MFDAPSRLAQAEKIARVLERFATGAPGSGVRLLDIGCSSGIITRALAARWAGALAVGVDVDAAALHAATPDAAAAARFAGARGAALPFPSETFHITVCNQVYQYVPDVPALLAEIARVLAPGGVCYFGARNLWGVASRQNWAPFLAAYAPGLVRRGDWTHRAGTPWPYARLRRVAAQYFVVHDYTTRVLADPALSDLFVPPRYRAWLARAPRVILGLVKPILPTHIWVLEKRPDL